jgi:hypothetical protein
MGGLCRIEKVTQLDEVTKLYQVTRTQQTPNKYIRSHNVEVINRWCSCGKWQEHDVPCIDAVAYYCIHEEKPLDYIFEKCIHAWYKYESHQKLFSKNIVPVVIDQLVMDGETCPPNNKGKWQAGRPKVRHIQNRSKYTVAEESPIICSLCQQRGHNKKTCLARRVLD